jgi:signal transduction histidine kinase
VGLRLKAQLICLFLGLSLVSFGVLTYFNLTLALQDNLIRNELSGRKLADSIMHRVELILGRPGDPALIARMCGSDGQELLKELTSLHDLRGASIYGPDGSRIFGFGLFNRLFPDHKEGMQSAMTRAEPFERLWAYQSASDLKGQSLDQVGPLFLGRIEMEHYQALFDSMGARVGVIHLTLEVPRGPLRLNLVLLGNVWLGAVFLISSLLAYSLWAEFAINRPLKGLMEAQQRLRELDPVQPVDADLLSSNELVTISRSFNRLALDLVKYQRELEEKTRRLEEANVSYRALNEGLEAKVEDATRDMKEFFSLVTHDLRIPLAAVGGYGELLLKPRSGPLTEKQRKYVNSITVANSHAQELVRNLLDAMRYEFGSPQLVEEDFDLVELAREVISHLAVEEQSIALETEANLYLVYADRTRIGRVLGNLLGNATRHARDVRVRIGAPEGHRVRVEVKDAGDGIPAEHLPLLFDKFKQFPSEKGPSSGLGLGLYIVRRILEDHGQTIELQSELGVGTTFSFWLPLAGDGEG